MTTDGKPSAHESKSAGALDRCSVSQLRDLLSLAVDPTERASSLPAEAQSMAELARLLTEFLPEEGESGQVLLEAVSDPGASLDSLQELKNLGKRLVDKAPSGPHRNAGRLLYHAAIAAAFARHGENISSLPIGSRLPLYEELATTLAREPLGAVFLHAVERAADEE